MSPIQRHSHPSFNLVFINHKCKNPKAFPWGFLPFGPAVSRTCKKVMLFIPYDFK
jgi:hypothetical protein